MGKRVCVLALAGLLAGLVGGNVALSGGGQAVFSAQTGAGAEEPGAQYIALTFDDGPKAGLTDRLLDGLAQRGVKATFFLIGELAAQNPQLVRRMAAEGHQVAMHTYSHVDLTAIPQTQGEEELARCRETLTDILGPGEWMLRPPYGFCSDRVKGWVGAPLILWSVDTLDWQHLDPAQSVAAIRDGAADGAIILMHDIFPTSVEGALRGVDELLAQGYYLVTVEELFALRGLTPQPGETYDSLPP